MLRLFLYSYSRLWIIFLIGSLVSAAISMVQRDIKSIIAYFSVNHMTIMAMVIMLLVAKRYKASLILMLFHGVVSSMLFMCCNLFYYSSKRRVIVFLYTASGFILFIFVSAAFLNLGVPPFLGFTSEILMIMSVMQTARKVRLVLIAGIMVMTFATVYMITNLFNLRYTTVSKEVEGFIFISMLILMVIIIA